MKRLSIILLLFNSLGAFSPGFEDKLISLRYKEVPLGIVLKDLTDKHELSISYSTSKIPVTELVSIDIELAPISRVFKVLLQGLPVEFNISEDQVTLKFLDLKQTVRGRVVDVESKTPIIGATVIILGSDPLKGGVTDVDGEFRIENVQVGRKSFKIDYIGYESKNVSKKFPEVVKKVITYLKAHPNAGKYVRIPDRS